MTRSQSFPGESPAGHRATPAAVRRENYRTYLVINTIGYLGGAVHLLLIPVFAWLDYPLLAVLNVFSVAAWVYAWKINRVGRHATAVMVMAVEVAVHTCACVLLLGWEAGFQYYLMASVPVILLNYRLKTPTIISLSVVFCALFAVLFAVAGGQVRHYAHPAAVEAIHYANIVIAFTAIGLTSFYFRMASLIAEQELEQLATTDSLTGLFNRRKMLDILEARDRLVARGGFRLCVLLADVDHFKRFNDTYGHECGDEVLRATALLIRERLREVDAVARWGGEEFLIMLSGTGLEAACRIAEELRREVASRRTRFGGLELSVTMTFGVAEHRPGRTLDGTLALADEALYRGKQAGRDCVMSRPAELEPPSGQPLAGQSI